MYIYTFFIHRERENKNKQKHERYPVPLCARLFETFGLSSSGRTYEKGQTNVATARIQGAECGEKSVRSRQETQEMETEMVNVGEFPWFWHDR